VEPSGLDEPGAQGEHLSPLENVLPGQVLQVLPLFEGTEPPGQTEQVLEPEGAIIPAGQSEHILLFEYLPEGHSEQRPFLKTLPSLHLSMHWSGVDVRLPQPFPAGHWEQVSEPAREKVSSGQSVHALSPALENQPAGQVRHLAPLRY
jgi:hypothetical protein